MAAKRDIFHLEKRKKKYKMILYVFFGLHIGCLYNYSMYVCIYGLYIMYLLDYSMYMCIYWLTYCVFTQLFYVYI